MNNYIAHVLVVDDDEGIRSLVKKFLNEKKYLVTTASNAENAYEKVNKVNIDVKFKNKRKGDVPIMFASSKKTKKYLGWKAKKSLNEMCKSAPMFYKNK